MYGDRGWGAACHREDLRLTRGVAPEIISPRTHCRPYSPTLHVLELAAKGTVRNKEVYTPQLLRAVRKS